METKIVVKKADALKRVFKSVSLDSLAPGLRHLGKQADCRHADGLNQRIAQQKKEA